MKFSRFLFLLTPVLLPACIQSVEERAESLVSNDVQAHFTRGRDYHPENFRSRPYTRYDSLVYKARAAALVGTATDSTQPQPAVLPPRQPADTVRIGTFVHHVYGAPDANGDLRLDSVDYVVSLNGRVTELLPEHVLRPKPGK